MTAMIDDLVDKHEEKFGQSPIPENARTFEELYADFCKRMGWRIDKKRVRKIVAEKVKSGEWEKLRGDNNQVYYFIREDGGER